MKTNKSLNLKNFGPLIDVMIAKLEDGQFRFSNHSSYPLTTACLREFSAPDYSERLMSDYGIPSPNNNKDVQKDYFEEILLIEKLLEEYKVPTELTNWQKGTTIKGIENMYKNLNRKNLATQIWEWYAIPWRHKNNLVYFIWQSNDVLGTPIIYGYPINYFLKILSEKFENHITNNISAWKQLNFWKNTGVILIIVAAIYVLLRLIR
ncbi:MAG: hypothetical protein PHE24_06195 [Patescibacteria group bacterium]|nr:hypothetical protein [Patescibacteria group bacterium]